MNPLVILCWLGWHAWPAESLNGSDVYVCRRCGRPEFQPS